MKKIFVLGSNSFSGQDFVRHLQSETKYDVYGAYRTFKKECMIGYDQTSKAFIDINLSNKEDIDVLLESLDQLKPEYIINFAAQSEVSPSWLAPEDWYDVNACFVARLANFMKGKSWIHKYLHVSTPEMYGHCDGMIFENQPYNPSTPYAASKMAGDICLKLYHEQFGIPVTWIRSANVCGPRQQLHKIIPRAAIFLLNDMKIPLHGGGTSIRGFTDIRDVSRAEQLLLEEGNIGEIYHVSNHEFPTIREVVRTVRDKVNSSMTKMGFKPFEQVIEDVPQRIGNDTAYKLNCDKIKAMGWAPKISLEQSISDTVTWIMENWKTIRDMPIHYEHQGRN